MEHYDELVKLRKKNGIDLAMANSGFEQMKFLPSSLILSVFKKEVTKKDKDFLMFENDVVFCRKLVPVTFENNLRNFIMLIDKNESISRIVKELYLIEKYNPYYSLIKPEQLSTNSGNAVRKAQTTLLKIKEAIDVFAVGERQGRFFTMCRYNSVDKNIARVFIENNCSILYAYFKNMIKLYFDPMLFTEEDLQEIANKINKNFNIKTTVDVEYNNYSIYFNSSDITSVDIFNVINENEKYRIGVKTVSNVEVKESENKNEKTEIVFKPVIKKNFDVSIENEEIKKIKISHKIKRK